MTLQEQLSQTRNATMERMPKEVIKTFTDSIKEIKNNQLKEKAIQVGGIIPNMGLTSVHGDIKLLSDLQTSEFLILNFYRGGWCPYCNMELREYDKLREQFNELDVDVIGISAEITELASTTVKKNALSFPVFTDVNAELMKAIGLVFQLDEQSKKEFKNFNMDFTKIHGNKNFELPVPAVYVINKKMEVVFMHFEADYMTRLEPSELLNIFREKLIIKNI